MKVLQGCSSIDRVQRIHFAIAGHILERNNVEISDLDETLQNTATEMPPQWWLMPAFAHISNSAKLLDDTVRLMIQFTHYHLLISRYDNNRLTAISASREILSRYVAFRSSNPAHFYCRGCDFFSFVSIFVLCFAHVGSRSQHHSLSSTHVVFNFLAHSRPSDRGMMERAMEILQSMNPDDTDSIATKLCHMIRHLLIVEADAARGRSYSMSSSESDAKTFECGTQSGTYGRTLQVHIPHFGTINFQPGAISSSAPVDSAPPGPNPCVTWASDGLLAGKEIFGTASCSRDLVNAFTSKQ
ncbi:hypothetical protein N7532_010636 [Penicillium argentinense]|uniref:Uncharacterized protein n=1 Tax=Penicillium argentinense TaxID=1131581 RepID=A0A9W9EQ72_9EURO|nr:uncharacterized protein N7532_010636 [Penicillium argentinense]KAJ5085865.1 hypothetical protein N7532_010636 [Penicillium argentinense]